MRHPPPERPPGPAQELLRRLPRRQRDLIGVASVLGERRGVSVYLVGGPVRDLLLGRPSSDIDLTVAGDALGYAEALAAHLRTRVTIHRRFRTATLILPDGLRLDVVTARREHYVQPAALPQVISGTVRDDLFRRDFTINAMALPLVPRSHQLLDPFGGFKDLEGRVLRSLHEHSYRDDPTRIFRGARYIARYHLRFSPRDRRLIRSALSERFLRRLSGDRLFHEFKLILEEPRPEGVLKILQRLGALRAIDHALAVGPGAVAHMQRVRRVWQRCDRLGISSKPFGWRVYLLALLLYVSARVRRRVAEHLGVKGPPLDFMIRELRDYHFLENRLEEKLVGATRIRTLLDRASPDLRILLWASRARRVRSRVERYHTRLASVKPALTGRDLEKFGFPPGPDYRRILALLLEGRVEGRLKSRADEIAFLRQRFNRPR